MKCINMQIGGIVIFLANFITIYSSSSPQDKMPSETTMAKDDDNFKSKLSKDCPDLLEIVNTVNKKYNVTDFGIDCKTFPSESISKETVLQHVCFVVKDLLNVTCDKKLMMNNKLMMSINSLKGNDVDLCPFTFSHLPQFGIQFQHKELVDVLTNGHCPIICYSDLNKPEPQCIVLSLYNNYLKTLTPFTKQKYMVPSETENSQIKLAETETTIQKTENTAISSKIEQQQQQQEKNELLKTKTETTVSKVSELAVTASKAVKVENQTEKPEAVTSTPKKEQTSESEVKSLGNENFMPDPIDEEPNEDDLGLLGIPSDMAPVQNIPKMESIEDKNIISSPKIYPDNGFFQAEDSHFFFYFIMVSSVIVLGYLAFHNKNKILAYALEGASSRRRGRRPNPARYKKLETNLEEVISSNSTNVAASSVVY